jgi:hypothetical protein
MKHSSVSRPRWSTGTAGTRIGASLHQLNRRWVRRTIRNSAVVLIVSDGWERDDPAMLAREMATLRRACHRIIWLDPLAGHEGFEPATQGLVAALPFVDEFLPCGSVASLEKLAGSLARSSPRFMTLPASAGSSPHLVLTFDFPPTGGGIARWLAEMARHYPPGGMVISTGSWPGSALADAEIPQRVDRLDIPSTRLRTPLGLARWSQRAQALVRETALTSSGAATSSPPVIPPDGCMPGPMFPTQSSSTVPTCSSWNTTSRHHSPGTPPPAR